MFQWIRLSIFLSGLLMLAGCFGGSSGPEIKLEPVTGTVTINEEPGSQVELVFLPLDGTPGTGAYAVTDETGAFTLKHRNGENGIEAGKYKVIFSKFVKPDGSPLLPDEDAATMGIEQLPAMYTNMERTKVEAEVPAGGNTLQFDLKVKTK
tara:strand:+ start:30004 stop:30456 length:453 start_codon:yes stop_codon:yes gene_type:complete